MTEEYEEYQDREDKEFENDGEDGRYVSERRGTFAYYLVNGEDLARVRYDPEKEEYVEGEVLDATGEWTSCPVSDILMDGEEISEEEAEERAAERGASLSETW